VLFRGFGARGGRQSLAKVVPYEMLIREDVGVTPRDLAEIVMAPILVCEL
jgi:hypothetical protein